MYKQFILQLFYIEMTGKHWSTYAQSFGSILLNPDLKDPHKGLKYSTFNLNFKFKESSDQVHADIKAVEFVFIYFFLFFVIWHKQFKGKYTLNFWQNRIS